MADHRYVKCAGISTSDEKNASTSMACAALETDLASAHTSVGRAGAARVSTRWRARALATMRRLSGSLRQWRSRASHTRAGWW